MGFVDWRCLVGGLPFGASATPRMPPLFLSLLMPDLLSIHLGIAFPLSWSSSGYFDYYDEIRDLLAVGFYYDWDPQFGFYGITSDNNPDLTQIITSNRYFRGVLPRGV